MLGNIKFKSIENLKKLRAEESDSIEKNFLYINQTDDDWYYSNVYNSKLDKVDEHPYSTPNTTGTNVALARSDSNEAD